MKYKISFVLLDDNQDEMMIDKLEVYTFNFNPDPRLFKIDGELYQGKFKDLIIYESKYIYIFYNVIS